MSPQMPSIATRREAMLGAANVIVTTGISSRASAFILPWFASIGANVVAGSLVELLKSWDLVPGTKERTAPTVYNDHRKNVIVLQRQGYSVQPLYSGGCAAGDFALSEATRGNDFVAIGTTTYRGKTCTTLQLDKADTMILEVVAKALRQEGFTPFDVEAAGHPIQPRARNRFAGNERYGPEYMTPAGAIAWKTNVRNPRGNAVTAIRSRIVSTNVHVEQLDDGGWAFDLQDPVDLRLCVPSTRRPRMLS